MVGDNDFLIAVWDSSGRYPTTKYTKLKREIDEIIEKSNPLSAKPLQVRKLWLASMHKRHEEVCLRSAQIDETTTQQTEDSLKVAELLRTLSQEWTQSWAYWHWKCCLPVSLYHHLLYREKFFEEWR